MVISSEPLIDYVPCQPARWPNRYLAHWDKDSVDDARMVKIDFLGLGMLSVVEECVDLIDRHSDKTIDLSRIDMTEDVIYDEICNGDTVGVFQIESRAQIAMLPRTQPRSLEDLTVQVSIVRPGPIVGGAVNPYVRRREARRRDPHFPIPVPACVRDVLDDTLGVVLAGAERPLFDRRDRLGQRAFVLRNVPQHPMQEAVGVLGRDVVEVVHDEHETFGAGGHVIPGERRRQAQPER